MTRLRTRLLTFCALAAVAAAAQAQTYPATPVNPATGTNGGMSVANHKQKELAKIQEKMQVLQSLQSCVNGAQTTDAIKQCNETARASQGHHEKKC